MYLSFLGPVTDGALAALDGNIAFEASDDLTLSQLLANDGFIDGSVAGDANIDALASGTDTSLITGGNLLVTSGSAGTTMTLASEGDLAATELESSGDMDLSAYGNVTAERLASTDGDIQLEAESVNLEIAEANAADAAIRIQTRGDQNLGVADPDARGYLSADGLVELVAEGTITFNEVLVGKTDDNPDLGGDAVIESVNGDIVGRRITASRDVSLSALRGNLILELIEAGRDGSLGMAVPDGAGYTIRAERDINVAIGGDFDSSKGSLEAGRSINLSTLGDGETDGDILLGGALAETGSINLDAAGDIRVARYTDGTVETSGILDAAQSINAAAGGDIVMADGLLAGGDVDLQSGGALEVSNGLTAGGSANMQAGNNITVTGDIVAGGALAARAGGAIDIADRVDVGGGVSAIAGDSVSFGDTVVAGGDVSLQAVDTVLVDVIETLTGQQNVVAGTDVSFNRLLAGAPVSVRAGGRIDGGVIELPQSVSLAGQAIAVGIEHTGERLDAVVTGTDGGLADSAALVIDTNGRIEMAQMHAEQASVTTNTSEFAIDSGWIGTELSVLTGTNTLYMNNRDASVRDVDVQLFEPDARFSLRMREGWTWTDAYVSHYRPGHDVQSPNYNAEREYTGIEYNGASVARDNNRFMQGGVDAVTRSLMQALGMPVQNLPDFILETDGIGGSAVNLDDLQAGITTESTDDETDV
jgi:hypothetical protein